LRLSVSRIRSCTVITVAGDVDAGNAEEVTTCVLGFLGTRKQLLLDLSGLEFCSAQGYSALQHVNSQCAQRGISWVVVPSAAVSRLLDDCDTTGTLPMADTTAAALHMLSLSLAPCPHLQRG
jgi:anti-anti-sigma factor